MFSKFDGVVVLMLVINATLVYAMFDFLPLERPRFMQITQRRRYRLLALASLVSVAFVAVTWVYYYTSDRFWFSLAAPVIMLLLWACFIKFPAFYHGMDRYSHYMTTEYYRRVKANRRHFDRRVREASYLEL